MRTLLVAVTRVALLGLVVVTAQITWAQLVANTGLAAAPYDGVTDYAQTPLLPAVPAGFPTPALQELPPHSQITLPRWSWSSATPSWTESQERPQEYLLWLTEHHPGKTIKPVTARVTAYCPCSICCGSSADGLTRSNRSALQPGLAVAEPVYRRARFQKASYHVPGYFPDSHPGRAWTPDDTGSAMLNSHAAGVLHIDIRYQNHGYALSKGVRVGTVYLIK